MTDRLVLASGSPRRVELLKRLVAEFEIFMPDVDETLDERGGDTASLVVDLAYAKADQASKHLDAEQILAADTVVVLDGRPLGKPATAEDALALLTSMSERTVQVVTGTLVLDRGAQRHEVVTSDLVMGELVAGDVRDYVRSQAWADKAGGLEIQDRARSFVDEIQGCWTNVVGLPLCAASRLLGVDYPPESCRVP